MNTIAKNFPLFLNDLLSDNNVNPRSRQPATNIKESEGEFTLELSVPGFEKDNFKIEVQGRVLKVSNEAVSNTEESKESYLRKEFNYNNFSRTFRLPQQTVDIDQIRASYDKGILTIHLPKKEEAKTKEPRSIEVD